MRKRLLTMLVLLAAVVTGAWADGIVCTASDLGKVLCTDGSIYENVSAATTAGKTAAAVIVYVDGTNKKGLAIALADEAQSNWSTAKSTCEGKTAITGAKWCLPSQNQWEQMFQANGGNTTSSDGLITTITTAGGTTLLRENATYWSSSENSPGVNACTVVLNYDIVGWGNRSEDNVDVRVRACLAFAPPSYAVTLAEGTEDAEKWTIPAEAEEGATVTATYSGTRKVKSVTAVKKAVSLIVNPVVGQFIGSDGKNYDANATLPDGVTKVAKIFYVGSDNGEAAPYNHGLALALEDVSDTKAWCSQTSVTCLGTQYVYDGNSNTEFNDLAGIANTDALVNNTGHNHAAAKAAREYNEGTHPTGTSDWFLPSAGQWDKMAHAAGSYANLKTNAGLKGGDFSTYWSSTECDAEHAWFFFPEYGGWNLNNKASGTDFLVRACLAF